MWYDGIVIVRMTVGVLLMLDGWRLFENENLRSLADLLFNMSIPFPEAMQYTSGLIGLIGGFFLVLGLFTPAITLLLFASFMATAFMPGDGEIFAANRTSFLLGLIALLFFFTGAGRISIDYILFINRRDTSSDSNLPVSKRFGRYVSKG